MNIHTSILTTFILLAIAPNVVNAQSVSKGHASKVSRGADSSKARVREGGPLTHDAGPAMIDVGASTLTEIPKTPDVYRYVEQMPEFPGNISEWLSQHIRYADTTKQGRVIVEFQVLKDGRVAYPKIAHSSGELMLDNEAIRVVKAMPVWKPGKQQGIPVNVYYMIPIVFRRQ